LIPPGALSGGVAVVIDQLRATTTITTALAAGAKAVAPCLTIEEAREAAVTFSKSHQVILGGERRGLPIEGFDFGNSPAEYTPDSVGDRLVIFTTTNGTKALAACESASQILLAAAINRRAVCEVLATNDMAIHMVCAGTEGQITREDVLVAGMIADGLSGEFSWNDSALLARSAWREVIESASKHSITLSQAFATTLRDTQGGRNLIRTGQEADLARTANLDSVNLVGLMDLGSGWIVSQQ
jgi:2-phosphosulfolactate phosphatase